MTPTVRRSVLSWLFVLGCGSRTQLDTSHRILTVGSSDGGGNDVGNDVHDAASPRCNDGGFLAVGYVLDGAGVLYRYDPLTLKYQVLGTPSCGDSNIAWTMTASRDHAYIVYTEDWTIYSVDLATLVCSPTAFEPGQLGLDFQFGVAVLGSGDSEQFFVYGVPTGQSAPILAVSDTASFTLRLVAFISPAPQDLSAVNLSVDAMGNLYAFSQLGLLQQIDSATGNVLRATQTGLSISTWAGLPYGPDLFLFAGSELAGYRISTGTQFSDYRDSGVSPIGAGSASLCP